MALLLQSDYREVRAAISPDLEAADLPDDVIGRDVYAGAAEREVLAIDPDAETRLGADQAHIRTATILLTASRLALRLTRVSSERFSTFAATYLTTDPERLSAELRAAAMTELRAIQGVMQDLATVRPYALRLAAGGRGDVRRMPLIGWRWPGPWW